ncbi:MAG: SDR family NAD(P)-dependent oxidoreductase, partial [Ancrocorticia sp.]|uniref:SDR family NAD(P)-dependent oxidoreductase n=1 Tax=Ancrocorticia sp. TaxID=2593684 RepID=UPI003F93D5FD
MKIHRKKRAMKLGGARVLITGAGSGIGRLMALDAARRGASEVVLWDVSEESAGAVCRQIKVQGFAAQAQIVNVADRAAVREA